MNVLDAPINMNVLIVAVHSAWICLKSLAQNDERTLKVFLLQHVGDAHLVDACTRCGVEACGRSHHDGLALVLELLKTPAAELLAVVYRQLGYGVEGAHRYRRVDARYAVETIDETLAALYVFLVNVAVVVLGRIKRCLSYYLPKQRRCKANRCRCTHDKPRPRTDKGRTSSPSRESGSSRGVYRDNR